MLIDLKSEPNFQIGRLTVSPSACRVAGASNARALQPRVMQVLVALAQAGGEVVTRERLIELAWNGVVVGDDAITRAIGQLRRLAEWDEARSFEIRTVSSIGYALAPIGPGTPGSAGAGEPLLAVLAFDNLSDDPALRFVSEGLSEDILQTIVRGSPVRVIGRSSSFQLRGELKTAKEVARELRATHMLDGAVRRMGDQVRITAHLMETASQTTVWSERFECRTSEIFDVQDRIAEQVVAALNRTFAKGQRPTDIDPAAYDLYLRGAELSRDIRRESQRHAVALLEAATQRMPNFADAWGELALARAQAEFMRFEPRAAGGPNPRPVIEADAARARALDPVCAPAQLIPFVGGALFDFADHRRRFEGPRPSKLGTTASPDVSLGVQLFEVRRVAEALEHFRQAEQLDPLFQIQIFYHCHALAASGQLEAAIAKLDRALARWPQIPFFAATRIGWAAMLGDWETADELTSPARLAQYPLGPRASEVAASMDACRNQDASPAAFRRLRDAAFQVGSSGLEPLLVHARHAGLAKTLELAASAGEPVVDLTAPRRPDDIGSVLLFLPFFADLRGEMAFPALCAQLGLADHWRTTGVWPTCADEFTTAASFQSACEKALAAHDGI